jgi:hypothetical protein
MGFGCGRDRKSCSLNPNGKYNPTNWLMMSKPKSAFMNCVKNNAQNVIEKEGNNFSYHKIGKIGLEKCITEMKSNDASWDYIHIPSTCQEYDNEGDKLNNIMKPYNIKDCSEKRYFFPLYNTAPGYPDWFKNFPISENANVRNCPAFPDYFSLGYILPMWMDSMLQYDTNTDNWIAKSSAAMPAWEIHANDQFLDHVNASVNGSISRFSSVASTPAGILRPCLSPIVLYLSTFGTKSLVRT